jgi:ferritin-like metal-binding protein YciE
MATSDPEIRDLYVTGLRDAHAMENRAPAGLRPLTLPFARRREAGITAKV